MLACAALLAAVQVYAQSDAETAPVVSPRLAVRPPQLHAPESGRCLQPGGSLTLRGRNLRTQAAIRLALDGHGLHLDLLTSRARDDLLEVTVPRERRLEDGKRYLLALEEGRHGNWISNTDVFVIVCSGLAAADPVRDAPTADESASPGPPPPDPATRPSAVAAEDELPATRTSAVAAQDELPGVARMPPADAPEQEAVAAAELPANRNPFAAARTGPVAGPASLLQSVSDDPPEIEPGELLVWHEDLAAAQAFAVQVAPLGFTVRRRLTLDGLGVVQTTVGLPAKSSALAARARLATLIPGLLVDANHRYRLFGAAEPGALRRLVGWSPAAATCAQGRIVGVVDTLTDTAHPALAASDIVVHDVLPAGTTAAGAAHGTAVAARIADLLPGATLRVAGVFRQREGETADTTAEWLLQALDWLVRQRVEVVNMSLGGPGNRLLTAGVERVLASGSGAVAAIGEEGPDAEPVHPAALPGVLGVTAVDREHRVYRRARHGDDVDLAAPGVDVPSQRADGSLVYLTGTSFAAPFVTAARLLAGSDAILLAGARDLGAPGRDPVFGAGLVRFEPLCTGAGRDIPARNNVRTAGTPH